MAEHIFNKLAVGQHTASSCGTSVNDKEGQKIIDLEGAAKVVTLLKDLAIEIGEAERKQMTSEMLEETDKIVLMSNDETVPAHLHKNKKVIYWDLPDPKEMSLEDTGKVRDQIVGSIKDLLSNL